MAVTLTKIPCYSPTPTLPALPAIPRKNTTPNDHSKRPDSVSSLHSNLPPSSFSQPVIYHSLPPRPPAVIPSSTTNRINSHSSYANDFDRAFDGLVSVTGGAKDRDGVSSICVPAKGSPPRCPCLSFVLSLHETENTGRTDSHVPLPDQHSLWRTTPIAASADPTPSSTREQSQPRDQLDPTPEVGMPSPRAVHADPNLGSADSEMELSVQRLSTVNREHPLVTPPAASSAPSCSASLRRSYTQTDLTPPDSGQPGSIISVEPSPDSMTDPAIRDLPLLFSGEAVGQSRENLQARSDRYDLGRNSHTHAKSPPIASGSEQLRLDIEDFESVSDTDDNALGSGDRWEYRRIKARRIDSSGRRMARVEWKDTWEPEDELDGLKMALRRYARERRAKRDSEGTCLKYGARKRSCPV
ncbi:uncharacterized protein TRUGW13939_10373 [Talaromyces rugulosus]|uniref:Uncharacterized protein n=1 Tax=Talaromyces rugulosus TaxID=121627 RepID=A0A7H8R9V6_TALRU|nr:uncharacterized protein TRUGW13939_10373 [Talaromyces rugulosus]QKX63204.1 hypothetical protein TRUGW13939_10373 [Talaromyces rugulosus]